MYPENGALQADDIKVYCLDIVNIGYHRIILCFLLIAYSKVPPLRNCAIRNLGLILLNKTPQYKKLGKLIHIQFLLKRCKVIV